jgi:DNA-binding IclR family transcriptional regulator
MKAEVESELRTVDRTLQLLGLFTEDPERAWSLSDLSRAAGFHKTTTLRMLSALERRSYVQRDGPGGTYSLGPAALALGGAPHLRLRKVAHAELRRLTNETGETSLLHVRSGAQTICIDKVESPEPIRVTYDIGRHGPLHAGSSGKTLIAFASPEEQDEVLSRIKLTRHTDLTITSRDALRKDLARIRKQGYTTTFGELDEGVYAVGAPIWNQLGRLEGGVSLVGPATRWTDERWPTYIAATLAAAERISHQLGFKERSGTTGEAGI